MLLRDIQRSAEEQQAAAEDARARRRAVSGGLGRPFRLPCFLVGRQGAAAANGRAQEGGRRWRLHVQGGAPASLKVCLRHADHLCLPACLHHAARRGGAGGGAARGHGGRAGGRRADAANHHDDSQVASWPCLLGMTCPGLLLRWLGGRCAGQLPCSICRRLAHLAPPCSLPRRPADPEPLKRLKMEMRVALHEEDYAAAARIRCVQLLCGVARKGGLAAGCGRGARLVCLWREAAGLPAQGPLVPAALVAHAGRAHVAHGTPPSLRPGLPAETTPG